MNCPKCYRDIESWRCAVCGQEDDNHSFKHTEEDVYYVLKCRGCGLRYVYCPCSPVVEAKEEKVVPVFA